MKRSIAVLFIGISLVFGSIRIPITAAEDLYANVKNSTVLVASYNSRGDFIARGSGFFVDEGIVITNIHVIYGGARYYRVFATDAEGVADPACSKVLSRSDIKLNLEDDVAYVRVFIACPHGRVLFADRDPDIGTRIGIFGYPALGDQLHLFYNTGAVIRHVWPSIDGVLKGPWLQTDGKIHAGNSGGPVVQDGKVAGIAVAAHMDGSGRAIDGFFIPVSQVRRGLEYANDSTFGYTPQEKPVSSELEKQQTSNDPFNPVPAGGNIPSNADCRASLGEGAEATGYERAHGDGCRCREKYHRDGMQCLPGALMQVQVIVQQPAIRPEEPPPMVASVIRPEPEPEPAPEPTPKPQSIMEGRVCGRVVKRFAKDAKMWKRVHDRVRKRFGFVCSQ